MDDSASPSDDILESLTLLGSDASTLPPLIKRTETFRANVGPQLNRMHYTHQDMVDFILANPGVSQNALAQRYGYSPYWVSQVVNSNAFQAYLAGRKSELMDPTLILTIEERMRGVTARSLDVLQQKLALPIDMISDELALRAATMGSKALGMGIAAPPPPAPTTNLSDLAERLASLARRPPNQGVVDVEAREVTR